MLKLMRFENHPREITIDKMKIEITKRTIKSKKYSFAVIRTDDIQTKYHS